MNVKYFMSLGKLSRVTEILGHIGNQLIDTFLDAASARVDTDVGADRRLIWRRDACEFLNVPGAGPFIEAFRVARLTRRHIGVDEDLVESVARRFARPIAVCAIG